MGSGDALDSGDCRTFPSLQKVLWDSPALEEREPNITLLRDTQEGFMLNFYAILRFLT